MKYDLLIKNGRVILDEGEQEVEVAVKDGKIAAIGHDLGDAEKVIDAKGQVVAPGMVDAHVHITEPGGGYRDEWEGYETGLKGAAKGGVTTIVEMPLNQVPATTDRASIQEKFDAGKGKLSADVASYGGLVPYNLDGGIQELDEEGVVAYKAFLATCGDRSIDGDFENVDDYSLYEGMKQIAKTGKILSVHAENADITDRLGEIAYKNGEKSLAAYVDSRPVFTEVEPIRKLILFAKETGCRLHIVHVACEEGVDEVIKAQQEGVDVTCETCTHYLYFYKEELDDIGPVVKCSPPIREESRLPGMWERVINGDINFVTSDHSPSTPDLKDTDNAFEAWGGIAGIQNNVDILFDESVQKRDLSLKRFAEIIATEPAKRFGLDNKGSIAVGKDADFVFIKPESSYTLQAEDLEYRNKLSPYVGRTINAQVAKTILRGEETYSLEDGVSNDFRGEFI
ncbi:MULTISPECIES: allantoinase AllB [Staphylococcus]|uniref:allantoinase AllB n=1 Tax=Staphylococcus TaxID=1279 RepID=UPI00076432F5|nr:MULTISPECIES: allantoinase AllB [Staphylococcus]KXA42580.1 allantoinase [Staphylococcus simulans]OFM16388.1 cyclic amidohydrolase [Staphylococcus sp. HMSC059E03]OFN20375.1 cyclic amidohydrolase [Staphylococcus sp. HMSC055C03]OFU79542.1 cyclic amidohydrolase [Staphylococcus sp. HMSC10C03]OFV05307.1 cyclic amidohydrolase [Staphylococcus sp. HMSC12H08]